jgi:hypothetical protein
MGIPCFPVKANVSGYSSVAALMRRDYGQSAVRSEYAVENRLLTPLEKTIDTANIERQRLGGLLNYYHRPAA